MTSQPKTFHPFLCLPTELRSQTWELSLPPSTNTSRIIHVHVTQQAYHPLTSKQNTHVPKLDYRFKCFSPSGPHGPRLPDTRARDAYAQYLRQNPNELCLDQGQRIRFNALKDTIFMDRASLYALGQYLIYRDADIIHRNLKGFNSIRTLGTPMSHCDREGFASREAYGLKRHALGGVLKFVTLRNMLGVPDEGVARSDLIHGLDIQLRDLLATRIWSQEAVDEIWEVKEYIPRHVDIFFGAPNLEDRLKQLQVIEDGEEELEESR